jgi:GPN-loop GTPase
MDPTTTSKQQATSDGNSKNLPVAGVGSGGRNSNNSGLPPVMGRIERGETLPVCIIFVGMAGSGKSSLVTQLQSSLDRQAEERETAAVQQVVPTTTKDGTVNDDTVSTTATAATMHVPLAYCVNLDPATINVPFDASIDIRDTVNYKQVMKQHQLGPNGAIMTSLNLFATKFDQVMNILERRAYKDCNSSDNVGTTVNEVVKDAEEEDDETIDYILVDTPGQIEAFTWSASGSIISESLASAFPTVLCFVVDTARCASSPNTFMSNMLYACSMLYRTRLPLVVCFNKIDVVSHEFCMEWMRDSESFQQALDDTSDTSGFYGSLTRSLSLVLDEFYSNFANACGVSAYTGDGIDEFWKTVQKAATQDFALDYIEDLKNRIEEQEARKRAVSRANVQRLQQDLHDTHIDGDDDDINE